MTPWETCHSGTASTICIGICLPEVVPPNYLGEGSGRSLGTTIPHSLPSQRGCVVPQGPRSKWTTDPLLGWGERVAEEPVNLMSFYCIFVIGSHVAQPGLKLTICRGRSQSLTLPSAGLTGTSHHTNFYLVLRWNQGVTHARQAL